MCNRNRIVFVIVALGTFAAWGAKVSAQYMLCFPDSYTIDISESGSPVNYLNGATSANQLAVYNITWSDSQTSSLSIVAHGELGPETYDMCQAAAPVYGGDCTPDQGRAPILCSPMFYDADLISGNGGEPAEFDASFQHNYVYVLNLLCGGLCANTYPAAASCNPSVVITASKIHSCGTAQCRQK